MKTAWAKTRLWKHFHRRLFKDTKGGWKQDWNSVFNEVLTYAMVLVLILLPITTLAIFNSCNKGIPMLLAQETAKAKPVR